MAESDSKLVVLGGGGVGKSALILRYMHDKFLTSYDPTIEDSYRKQVTLEDETAVLEIMDTAGQEDFHSMMDKWIQEGEGFMLIYSVTARASLEEVDRIHDKILATKEGAAKIPVVVVGNKCDMKAERQVTEEEGRALAEKWGASWFESSARNRINHDVPFVTILKEIRKMKENQSKKKKKPFCAIL